jgi:hypothetical protein
MSGVYASIHSYGYSLDNHGELNAK